MAGRGVRTYGRWGGSSRKNDDLWQKAVQPNGRMNSPIFSSSSDGSTALSSLSLSTSTDDDVFKPKQRLKKTLAKTCRVQIEDCMKGKENRAPSTRPPRHQKKATEPKTRAKRNNRATVTRKINHNSSSEDGANYDFSDIEKHSLIISDSPSTKETTHSAETTKAKHRRKSIARTIVSTSTPNRICASLAKLHLSHINTSTADSPMNNNNIPTRGRRYLRSSSSSTSEKQTDSDNSLPNGASNKNNDSVFSNSHDSHCGESEGSSERNETYDPSQDLFADSIQNSLYVSTRRSKRVRAEKNKDSHSKSDHFIDISEDMFVSAADTIENVDIEDLELSAIDEEEHDSDGESFESPDKKQKQDTDDCEDTSLGNSVEPDEASELKEGNSDASAEESDASSLNEESSSEEDSNSSGEDEFSENHNVSRYMLIEGDESSCQSKSSVYTTPSDGRSCNKGHSESVDEASQEDLRNDLDEMCRSFKDMLTPVRTRRTKIQISPKAKLLRQCEQSDYVSFSTSIPPRMMKNIKKIGEGVYGEVFRAENLNKESVALKVMPIEGDFPVNDEPQKTFEEMLPEIVISKELSALEAGEMNRTENYVQVNRVSCVQGKFPARLLSEWDAFSQAKISENDRPDVFNDKQLFIVFEFGDGGSDLEHYKFNSAVQALCIFQQVAWALAIAESAIEFEHRDLHWGNILVKSTNQKHVNYTLNGDKFSFETQGVLATIIDFTLSRLTQEGTTVFSDLSTDETLFQGDAKYDYQFEVYRKMKEANRDNWESFEPLTNIFWLHYLADKLVNKKRYKSTSKTHQEAYSQLQEIESSVQDYDSALHLVLSCKALQH